MFAHFFYEQFFLVLFLSAFNIIGGITLFIDFVPKAKLIAAEQLTIKLAVNLILKDMRRKIEHYEILINNFLKTERLQYCKKQPVMLWISSVWSYGI